MSLTASHEFNRWDCECGGGDAGVVSELGVSVIDLFTAGEELRDGFEQKVQVSATPRFLYFEE